MGNKYNYLNTANNIELPGDAIDGRAIAYELRKTIGGYFPNFQKGLTQVADHRKRKEYGSNELLSAAIAMFKSKN